MDATTKERAGCSSATSLRIADLDLSEARMAERQALVAEHLVNSGLAYQPGGRGLDGAGVDGFGFLRLCIMSAAGRQLADLYGYPGWPEKEPREQRVANLIEDWGLIQVGRHDHRDYRRGDVVVYAGGDGPAGVIVVQSGNQDRGALGAACRFVTGPAIAPLQWRESGGVQVRVYRWLEA